MIGYVTSQTAWYLARASGIVAWGILTFAVVWGLLLRTRLLKGRPSPRWLLDLHRFLGALALLFTGLHIAGLVADNYVHFGLLQVLVPFASGWRPLPVALGVVAMYLLVAVELTSLLMRYLPKKRWRQVHLTSFGAFWLVTVHGLFAGSDTRHLLVGILVSVSMLSVLFLVMVRLLSPSTPTRARVAASRP
jgi:predicted ferric reductase